MTNQDNEKREREAKQMAKLIKETRRNAILSNFVNVALSSYMNGVSDTYKSFNAADAITKEQCEEQTACF